MASLPPRQPQADPHKLSAAGNVAQATKNVNRFAKRDPSLYPLAAIFMYKGSQPAGERKLMADSKMVHPWDDASKHDTHPSATAEWKYRHKTREGHWEDALPALNSETRNLNSSAQHKFSTTK